MHAPAAHALNDFLVMDVDFDNCINKNFLVFQRFSLCQGARKSIEKEAVRAVRLGDALFHQPENYIVGYQTASIHDLLRLDTQRSPLLDRGAQHVAGRNLGNPVLFFDVVGLGSLSGTRTTEQNNTHLTSPFSAWILPSRCRSATG